VEAPQRTLLLSVDFEDWHQLVRRRVGASNWREPGPALDRQTKTMLALFAELDVRCTFFILGQAARAHPDLVSEIAEAGHEIACHGDAHLPVFTQTPAEFATDLRRARASIEQLTGQQPDGYRAPAFSITKKVAWAYGVLAAEGFSYDASHSDSPVHRDRSPAAARAPHRLTEAGLWEFPVAAWHWRSLCLPVGGASYWSVTPTLLVLYGLDRAAPWGGLYLHPHELDTEPLRPLLEPGTELGRRVRAGLRTVQRNAARRRAADVLRAIADRFRLTTYGEAHARLSHDCAAGP
jgi:polysaccharide deacetylase family protein (PEP-CTERM system associated)